MTSGFAWRRNPLRLQFHGVDMMDRFANRQSFVCFAFSMLCLAGWHPATAQAENWAEKMFKNKSHDFRTVGRGTKCEHYFQMTNPYKEDVHIAAVRTSCGCTTPSLSAETLATHETGNVIATFNTNTHIGEKAAVITVVFDRPSYAEVQLKVKGHIRTDITFDPPEVDFGEVAPGTQQEREVTITHTGNSNWEIRDVRSHFENLRVRLSAPERSPGMIRYRMKVRLDDKAPEGDLRHRLTLISNDRSFPTTEMAISGRVRPSLSVSPAAVGMGTLSPDGSATKRLIIRGEEPFAVTEVQCPDDRFAFDLPEGRKKIQLVTLTYTGDGSNRTVSQEVRVVTDLPGNKSAKCIVTGTVR